MSPTAPTPAAPRSTDADTGSGLQRWHALLALTAIVALTTLGNLLWMRSNQILTGRDASGYLLSALKYRDSLAPLTWQGIFNVFVESPYRTPALYLAAQPFLALPGDPQDVAQLLNILLHVVTILITFALARTVAGRGTSLLAAALVAFLPLMAAMARLFYTEMFLVATVAANLLALYRSQGFSRRGWSLLWGLSAGVGLLVKWTFPIYMALPLLVALWRARQTLLPRRLWNVRAFIGAALAGAVFVALWWLPNRTLAATLPAGDWAALGWLLIVAGAVYSLWVAAPESRWFPAAALLAVWIASLWYLPHANFASTLLTTDVERGSNPLGLLDWKSFADYGDYWYRQHFGALLFWIIVPAALLPWFWRLIRQRRSLCPPANLLWWSLLSAILVLLLLSQRNARNLVPLLPQVAVLAALGIAAWPRRPRLWIATAALVALLLQWTVITFDGAQPLYALRSLWVIDAYALPPASGRNDPGYGMAAELLDAIAGHQPENPNESLGVLVNAEYFHRGSLRYLVGRKQLSIAITDLTEANATWQNLIDSQWIALKDGSNHDAEPAALALIERIHDGDSLFNGLYALVQAWQLPNGETLSLYHRPGPGFPDSDPDRSAAAQSLAPALFTNLRPTTPLLYGSPDLAVWLGRFSPPGQPRVLPADWQESDLAPLSGLEGTVAAVLDSSTAALESWLDRNALRGATFNPSAGDEDMAIVFYDFSAETQLETLPVTLASRALDASLLALRSQTLLLPGEILQIESRFAADVTGLKWSVRLEDAAGIVFAAADRPVLAQDRFGLLAPGTLAPGRYRVMARLYEEATLTPVVTSAGTQDTLLFEVVVQ